MKPGPKKHEPLAYPNDSDDTSEETLVFVKLHRSNNTDTFYTYDPFTMLINQEEQELEQEMRDQEIKHAQHLVEQIRTILTPRQQMIWQLRAELVAFKDIAYALQCSERTVFNEWAIIRQVTWNIVEGEE